MVQVVMVYSGFRVEGAGIRVSGVRGRARVRVWGLGFRGFRGLGV